MKWELAILEDDLCVCEAYTASEVAHWRCLLEYRVRQRTECVRPDLNICDLSPRQALLGAQTPSISAQWTLTADRTVRMECLVRNVSSSDVALERICLSAAARLGAGGRSYGFFNNGHQSWSETRSFRRRDRQLVPLLRAMTTMQANSRNLPTGVRGQFRGEMYGVVGNLDAGSFLLVGQAPGFNQFVYVGLVLDSETNAHELQVEHDFGGQVLPPGARVQLDGLVLMADGHANRVQDDYLDLIQSAGVRSRGLPSGWCSWYYYYGKVSTADIRENLQAASERKVDWEYFVLDDGYERAVGDWLLTNGRFPEGLGALAEEIRSAGMTPGLWIAPFVVRRNSQLFRSHPEWILRDNSGQPILAGWNPNWGLEGRFYGLDTTHPGFQEQLRAWIRTIVHGWGFEYLKLDFTYGASLSGCAYDPHLSTAQRLSLGYRIVREAAGKDVFMLGCGSPLSPAIGLVDALRIGPDVAPYWFDKYRYYLTRDPHALCTKFAIRSILNRCQMHRRLWINDPDCMLLRSTETKLSADERMSLVNAVIITGGACALSDRLSSLPDETWDKLGKIQSMASECDTGRAWALDHMEQECPGVVYNSSGYLAVFNMSDEAAMKQMRLLPQLHGLIDCTSSLEDVWTGARLDLRDGVLGLGPVPAHSSRLFKVRRR